jgi:hypothetical protein
LIDTLDVSGSEYGSLSLEYELNQKWATDTLSGVLLEINLEESGTITAKYPFGLDLTSG